MKHFINLKDIKTKDLRNIILDAKKRKKYRRKLNTLEVDKGSPLKGKLLIQMFEKSSLRTRLSFYLAIKQLGGGTITLRSNELHLGQGGESIADTAKILSTYGDGFMLRTDDDNKLENFKKYLTIPVINGLSPSSHPTQVLSDIFTVEEIKIGDNDTLSATVACLVDAQLLIILSDVEGLYNRDPASKIKGEKAELVSHVGRVNEEIERTAGKSNNRLTVGGMYTKVLAAKKTMSFGIPTLVVNGLDEKILENVFSGKDVGTLFWSGKGKIRDRKHWIAHTLKSAGVLIVDEGARKALVEMGKSLLPAGLKKIQGEFEFGKAVKILDEEGKEIGRGLVNYNSRDLQQIKGMKTSAIKKSIGDSFYEEVIHRDDLVIF